MPSLFDAFKQYINDAKPGGLLNPEVPPGGPTELAKGLLSFTPGIGDAISGYDAYQSAKQGNYGEAALNGLGLLPFVPAMGGVVKSVASKSGKKYLINSPDEWAEVYYRPKGEAVSKTFTIRPESDARGNSIKEGILSIYKDSAGTHLNDVSVDAAKRNDGLASLLMEEALKNTDGKGLWGSTGFSGDGLMLANKFGLTKKDGKYFIPYHE